MAQGRWICHIPVYHNLPYATLPSFIMSCGGGAVNNELARSAVEDGLCLRLSPKCTPRPDGSNIQGCAGSFYIYQLCSVPSVEHLFSILYCLNIKMARVNKSIAKFPPENFPAPEVQAKNERLGRCAGVSNEREIQ